MKKLLLTTLLAITIFLSLGLSASAATIPDEFRPDNAPLNIFSDEEDIDAASATNLILQTIASGLLYFAAPLAVVFIAQSAYSMVEGGADTEKLDQAKKQLQWAILGLILIILSYSLVQFIIGFTVQKADIEAIEQSNQQNEETSLLQPGEQNIAFLDQSSLF